MTYFEKLRRPLIIVSPELFPLNEAIEVRPRHPGRICGARGSEAKAEPPRPDQLTRTERSECALPLPPPLSGAEDPALLALSTSEGSLPKGLARKKTEGSRPKPARPRRKSPLRPVYPEVALATKGPAPINPARHAGKCRVCSHPDRDAIEEAFIHWHSPTLIAQDYEISDDSLYRHAYATGLDAVRSRNLRCALERILEKAQRVVPTADSIVRAARAYTRINDAGEWVEPPMHVIVSSGSAFHLAELRAAADPSSPCTERSERVVTHHSLRPSNRGIGELENGSTR